MKVLFLTATLALLVLQADAFSVAPHHPMATTISTMSSTSSLHMFSGAGDAAPKEDNQEDTERVAEAAKAMGMSLDEYNIAMNARIKLAKTLDDTNVKAGKEGIQVERDINNPPKNLKITITEEGKALGKEVMSKTLVAALKKGADDSRSARTEAQKTMMAYIQDQLKD